MPKGSKLRAAIINGTLDSTNPNANPPVVDKDPAVVEILYYGAFQDNGQRVNGAEASCTGELIGNHTILTAGHCSDDSEINPYHLPLCTTDSCAFDSTHQTVLVLFNNCAVPSSNSSCEQDMVTAGRFMFVDSYTNPGYNGNIQGPYSANHNDNDIGLVHVIGTEMENGTALPGLLTVNTTSLGSAGTSLGSLRFVGYGLTNPNDQNSSGVKYTVNKSSQVEDTWHDEESGAGPTCSGDSGGPSFKTFGGVEKIVAVTSLGDENCDQFSEDVRVDAYACWIDTTMKGSAWGDSNGLGVTITGCSSSTTGGTSGTSGGTSGGTTGSSGDAAVCSTCTQDSDCGAGAACAYESQTAQSGYCAPACTGSGGCTDSSATCGDIFGDGSQYCYPQAGCGGASTTSGGTSGGTTGSSGNGGYCAACSGDGDCGSGGLCVQDSSSATGGSCTVACSQSNPCTESGAACFEFTDNSGNVVGDGCFPANGQSLGTCDGQGSTSAGNGTTSAGNGTTSAGNNGTTSAGNNGTTSAGTTVTGGTTGAGNNGTTSAGGTSGTTGVTSGGSTSATTTGGSGAGGTTGHSTSSGNNTSRGITTGTSGSTGSSGSSSGGCGSASGGELGLAVLALLPVLRRRRAA